MISVLNKIVKINRLLVLGINRTDEGEFYYCLYVRKNKSRLEVTEIKKYDSFELVIANINPNIPVIILVDGKGVLNKRIDSENEKDIAWRKNIDLNSLYYTSFNAVEFDFYSFVRREGVDDIIGKFKEKKVIIVDFYLGSLTTALLHSAIQKDVIYSNDHQLEFSDNKLVNIKKAQSFFEEVYTFDNTQLSAFYLPLYGAAIDFYIRQKQIEKNKPEKLDAEEYIYQKSFNLLGVTMLVLFFCSLLMSYLLIQYYSDKNLKLNQENVFSNQTYQRIIKLEELRNEKLKILNETRQSSKNFLSFYAYEIAKSVPGEVKLSDVNIFPVEKDVKSGKKIGINLTHIILKGTTLSESAFNEWIETLKRLKWIKTFEILSIKKDRKGIQHFEIKVIPDDF